MWCTRGARDRCVQDGREGVRPGRRVRGGAKRCVETRTASSAGGLEKRSGSNPATALQTDPTYVLEDDFEVMLVNPRHARNMPGRKTDVSDAAWLADLGAHGLVHGSLVPPEPIRQRRDLTRPAPRSCANAPGECSGCRNCSKTPGSNCPPWPPT